MDTTIACKLFTIYEQTQLIQCSVCGLPSYEYYDVICFEPLAGSHSHMHATNERVRFQ